MRESCYCGRVGEVEDREPVLRDGRTEALRCRRCGRMQARGRRQVCKQGGRQN
ncbi:MAG: hypothetical protein AVDCRST_MAG01-01-433 [uncultured Rubrobacteraceae bacterium]|uniref:Uncharacterized protein n=1 Tax=uncultured Rubrobacteraceae bacterium TaxID=349277 RepID=A0A6J4NJ25_9ACTN|nr:MAG: hypothetical protein AVDCRST_MAG01-01-433 [uncultured Rubrobacteraceae bacterium]